MIGHRHFLLEFPPKCASAHLLARPIQVAAEPYEAIVAHSSVPHPDCSGRLDRVGREQIPMASEPLSWDRRFRLSGG